MNVRWKYTLLCALSIAAYSGITVATNGAREPPTATRAAAPSNLVRVAATPAPESVHGKGNAAPDLSAYVHMHQTRNANIPLRPAARANACVE